MSYYALAVKAREFAEVAHAGQVDKAGRPYIEHVIRVALAVYDDLTAVAVAYLHDVIEDSPSYVEEMRATFPAGIVRCVVLLTRYPAHKPSAYYAAIKADPVALRVKLADIADNADESRLALLDTKTAERLRRKYAKAREALA
jgi:(p)ppGpp synthase/HD superfamily hydrolase